MSKSKLLERTGYFLFLVFFISLFFSFRAISSFALGSLLIWSLVAGKPGFKRNTASIFLLACSVYFGLGFIHSLRSPGEANNSNHGLLQAGLLLTGSAIYLSFNTRKLDWDRIFHLVAASLCVALLYCLTVNAILFSKTGDTGLFFYHSLVSPAKQHAVYFSIYVFAVLTWLFESVKRKKLFLSKNWYIAAILFFSIALFFLSSKLVLGFYAFYLLLNLFQFARWKNSRGIFIMIVIGFLALLGLGVLTKNPVSDRFREIVKGDVGLVKEDQYDPGIYFDGLQFRMLQWRLVTEILNEKRAWTGGVGVGAAQDLLDKKYRERNMYIGDPQRKDTGFLGYNTHNQFLESLLQNGIIGSLVFLLISLLLLKMAWEKRSTGFALFFILLFVYSFTESVFETQYGIILFSFLPLFLYSRGKSI